MGAQQREAASIIRGIANLLLLVGSRQAREITLPLNFIYADLPPKADDFARLVVDQPELTEIRPIDPIAKRISGKEGIVTYCKFCFNNSQETTVRVAATEGQRAAPVIRKPKLVWYDIPHADQIIFHCVFGSYADNLGLLDWMYSKMNHTSKAGSIWT